MYIASRQGGNLKWTSYKLFKKVIEFDFCMADKVIASMHEKNGKIKIKIILNTKHTGVLTVEHNFFLIFMNCEWFVQTSPLTDQQVSLWFDAARILWNKEKFLTCSLSSFNAVFCQHSQKLSLTVSLSCLKLYFFLFFLT